MTDRFQRSHLSHWTQRQRTNDKKFVNTIKQHQPQQKQKGQRDVNSNPSLNKMQDYPNCDVTFPSFIGDGHCSTRYNYNTAECGFDGGDCEEFNRVINKYPYCSVSTYKAYRIGDGNCNDDYNTAECGFDDGDCGGAPVRLIVFGVAGAAFFFFAIGIFLCKISKRNDKTWALFFSFLQEHLQEVVAGGGGVQTGNAKDDINNQQEERFPDVEATGSSARNIHKPVLQSQDWKSGEAM
jgi:hypothetical protein